MGLLYFVLIIGLIITVHEFGHFIIGKISGVVVEEFAIGMGPKIVGFTKEDTLYSLRLLPIGGYCKFKDEDGLESENQKPTEGSFNAAPVHRRINIVAAGPIFNIILCYFLCLVVCSQNGIVIPVVNEVMEGYPAEEAGIQPGDEIIKINGSRTYTSNDVTMKMMFNTGEPVRVVYERDGVRYKTEIVPKQAEDGSYLMGCVNLGRYEEPTGLNVFKHAYYNTKYYSNMVMDSLKMLFKGQVTLDDVTGPVGMAQMVTEIEDESTETYGFEYTIMVMVALAAMLSINVGLMNLLPIPALDGGKLIFLIIEAVRGKALPVKYEAAINGIFLLLLFGFMIVVSFNDLLRIFI